jgi:hypothetical protein
MNDRTLNLTPFEKQRARQAATEFIEWSEASMGTDHPHRRVNAWESNEQRFWVMSMAYGSEIGIARKLNMQWNGLGTGKKTADVGNNIEVRWTTGQNLIVRANDRENDIVFLTKGTTLENLYIVGFLPVKMARVPEYKIEGEETWKIPIAKLYTYMPQNGTVKRFIEAYSRLL